jgi:hypothetical protein
MVPLPPARPPQAELDKMAAPVAAPAAKPAALAPQQEGSILDEIGSFLESIFGGSGGQSQMPGYQWDALQGWVPTAGKDNAGMLNAAQNSLAPPAAPDAPQRPVAPVPVAGDGMKSPALPGPGGAGFDAKPIQLQPAAIPDAFGGAPTGKPGRFK